MGNNLSQQVDRTAISIGTLDQDPLEETRYWLSKTPEERLQALEQLRMRMTGYDNSAPRLQRILTVTERT